MLSTLGLVVTLICAVLICFALSIFLLLLFIKKLVAADLQEEVKVNLQNGEIGGSQTFSNVWYSSQKRWYDLHLLAYKDVGRLTINEKSMEFKGRTQNLMLDDIRRVSFGKQGRDFVNNWVRVDYGDGASISTALFADGNMLGWRGVFGGTQRIFDTAKHLTLR